MEGIKAVTFAFFLLGFHFYTVQCQSCVHTSHGTIYWVTRDASKVCWTISVPSSYFLHLQIHSMESEYTCEEDYVRINVAGTRDVYKFCSSDGNKNPVIALNDITVTHEIKPKPNLLSKFYIDYTIKTLECLNNNSFECDSRTCIPEDKVCDGVKDCENGKDETECKSTGVLTIKGVLEAREKAVFWLKKKRSAVSGWKEDTPRAVIALYLASAASFNGTVLEEELMAIQTEFVTAVALLKSPVTNFELSMFINALMVTCHSPLLFYGNNLVKRLKAQVEESGNFTHPLAYLALCNANESWPLKAAADLDSILSSNSEYPFAKDLQAMALMAVSCEANRNRNIDNVLSNTTSALYEKTIQYFKRLQAHDGSFGNIYTTALITQALLASGQEHSRDWNLNATIKYLIKELNSSSVDLLSIYLVLPILNGQSLINISYVNCSANPRKHGEDLFNKVTDLEDPKIGVQYSLYIGDEKPAIHTIPLKVPANYTASEVMKLAELEDPKYKFEWKMTSGKMYVYKIANVKNDPEAGKFWLMYQGTANSSEPLSHLTEGPDEIIMDEGEHLVFWYKSAAI